MLTDNTNNILRRLLLAPLVLFGLASIIATGGGSSGGSGDDDDEIPVDDQGSIVLSETEVAVVRGETVRLRVDVQGLPEGVGVSGYSIDLSEVASRIDVQTAACPAGAGTPSCRDWTISPADDSVPGKHPMRISAAGGVIAAADLTINVIGNLPPLEPARVASGRLVIADDGRLWARGQNHLGQAGVGFWNACMDRNNHHCLLPTDLSGFVQVGNSSDWVDATTADNASIAVRGDGTVWLWGDNPAAGFGFPSTEGRQIFPQQVADLAGVERVTIADGGFETRFLALTESGQVYAWGGSRISQFIDGVETSTRAPRRLPQAVSRDGEETPLGDVAAIAGATTNSGGGFALALKNDGTVWHWGGEKFYGKFLTGIVNNQFEFRAMAGMPAPVAGVPLADSIAVGRTGLSSDPRVHFALVATRTGEVLTWSENAPTPQPVAGLSDIASVSADYHGLATALGRDGSVWRWSYETGTPQRASGLPPIARLGAGTADSAIVADCTSATGSLWAMNFGPTAVRVPRFGMNCQPAADFELTIDVDGEGVVVTDPPYVSCGSGQTCSARVPSGTFLTVHAAAAPGWQQADSGPIPPCSGSFIMDEDRTCSLPFELQPLPRTLAVFISGGGSVTSEPEGIDCPDNCTQNYAPSLNPPASVTLTATALRGYRFTAFRGDPDCTDGSVTMSISRQCDAVFTAFPTPAAPTGFVATPGNDLVTLTWTAITDSVTEYALQRAEGTGPSIVIAEIAGAASSFRDNAVVPGREYTYRLTASNFSGSSPPATATATVPSATSVTLTVLVTGPGRVTSSPAGIDCPGDCTQSYSLVGNVTLTATANANARFDGWGSACAGTSPTAVVTTDDNKTCSATFSSTSAGGWVTLASDIASSFELNLHSSVALAPSGLGFVAYLQAVDTQGPAGIQNRLSVRRIATGFPPFGLALNATANWSATSPQLVIDPTDTPVMIFCADLSEIWVARWNGLTWSLLAPDPNAPAAARLNLTPGTGTRPRMVRSGNTLIAAWMENARIAVRRYDLTTQQWDAGAFIPTPTNPFDIDLAVDQNGLAVVAWSDGLLGARLQATRETSPGTWVAVGGEIGTRPPIAPMILEFGVHVDTSNVIRIVWVEGDTNYFVQLAQFDGTNWVPLPGRTETRFQQSAPRVRTLHVNHEPALFAFAYAVDIAGTGDSFIVVQQLLGNSLVSVGSEFQTTHPQIGDLSFSMLQPHAATMAQSQFTPAGPVPYRLAVRRHNPL